MELKAYASLEDAIKDVARLPRFSDVAIVSLDFQSTDPPYGIICDRSPILEDEMIDLGEDWWGGGPQSDIVWRFKDNTFPMSGKAHRQMLTVLQVTSPSETGDISVWEKLTKSSSEGLSAGRISLKLPLLSDGECVASREPDGSIRITHTTSAEKVRDTARLVFALATVVGTDLVGKTTSQQVIFDRKNDEATSIVILDEKIEQGWRDSIDNIILKEIKKKDYPKDSSGIRAFRAISP